jgi:hypothetical protein
VNLVEARTLALSLMTEHGIASTWSFEFDNAQRRLGVCVHTYRRITISRYIASAATPDQVRQTMLHEIAHALLGPRHHHNDVWKAKAASIGYTGKRTTDNPYKSPTAQARTARLLPVDTSYVARVGDSVRLRSGIEGVVTKVARTRSHVLCSDGQTWSVPFGLLKQVAQSENTPVLPARPVLKRIGETVTFVRGGSFLGKTATILSVGPSRYKVKLDGSVRVLFAPFELVS